MEQRLIDATVLQGVMDGNISTFELIDDCTAETMRMCKTVIDEQPTVDAVPVVRCGECKHWIDCDGGLCARQDFFELPAFGKGDFCSYGERREQL